MYLSQETDPPQGTVVFLFPLSGVDPTTTTLQLKKHLSFDGHCWSATQAVTGRTNRQREPRLQCYCLEFKVYGSANGNAQEEIAEYTGLTTLRCPSVS
ncbi:Hypothetical protein CINCED_3A023037 [Cinara cedri]|uniref:Uncharacterized protein n=1 Tax=Cinara cedri TaxID=506608 RepID=A0A5E4N0A0_9HEMI|nr:Hypothetical protein CINCED_3A023037 [Cinara cedri]